MEVADNDTQPSFPFQRILFPCTCAISDASHSISPFHVITSWLFIRRAKSERNSVECRDISEYEVSPRLQRGRFAGTLCKQAFPFIYQASSTEDIILIIFSILLTFCIHFFIHIIWVMYMPRLHELN